MFELKHFLIPFPIIEGKVFENVSHEAAKAAKGGKFISISQN